MRTPRFVIIVLAMILTVPTDVLAKGGYVGKPATLIGPSVFPHTGGQSFGGCRSHRHSERVGCKNNRRFFKK